MSVWKGSRSLKMLKLTKFDYEYLTGTWSGSKGVAFQAVDLFCGKNDLGDYGKPTPKGEKALAAFLRERRV
jgi:hypothetical protein